MAARGNLPSVYDGIYQAAYSYGMSRAMTRRLIKLLASDVDFQSRLNPTDQHRGVLLAARRRRPDVGRFRAALRLRDFRRHDAQILPLRDSTDGSVDYFDEDGRSVEAVPAAQAPAERRSSAPASAAASIRSSAIARMHTGVDWAAPRGTPIIAAGNGVVEKAGWAGGYGRQTIIRHANGYETSYNHQSGIAAASSRACACARARSSALSARRAFRPAPHLHYELIVNGRKVDPMRVRLPTGRALKGEDLSASTPNGRASTNSFEKKSRVRRSRSPASRQVPSRHLAPVSGR